MKIYCEECTCYNRKNAMLGHTTEDWCMHPDNIEQEPVEDYRSKRMRFKGYHKEPSEINKNNDCKQFSRKRK